MKKFVSLAFAIVLMLAFSATAFAAPSPGPTTGTDTPGVALVPQTTADLTADANTKFTAKLSALGGISPILFDLSGTPGSIRVLDTRISAGINYKVLHFTGGAWVEIAPTGWGNGWLTFTASSFSPFAVVNVPGTASNNNTTTSTATTAPAAGVRSPSTSGFDMGFVQAGLSLVSTISLLGASGLRFAKIMK